MAVISKVRGREVLDSRGDPTVEVEVILSSGVAGLATVPSGASRGRYEAVEVRDGDPRRFQGRGVLKAVRNVNEKIAPSVFGRDPTDQRAIDETLVELDGTENKSNLGANAILGVSLAVAKAAAAYKGLPLYRYFGGPEARLLPLPMINIISGGLHAARNIEFQDFLILPISSKRYSEALSVASDIYHSTRNVLSSRGHSVSGVAEEGGFGPSLESNLEGLHLMVEAVEMAGYKLEQDIVFGLDVAASHFFRDGSYQMASEDNRILDSSEMVDFLEDLCSKFPIISIEDGLAEDDWNGWGLLTKRLGRKVQLIGDDLFVTNRKRLTMGIDKGVANGVLVKPNQIGTLSEAIDTIDEAKKAGYFTIISTRSGETEDTSISDLAVGTNAGQIKIGSLARSERLAKYNQLLRIEEELGPSAIYAGKEVFKSLHRL